MIKLIAALGNPGIEYQMTRHNIAWQFVKYLSFFDELDWKTKFRGSYSQYNFNGEKIHILLPETFMNRSGTGIKEASDFFKIDIDEIVVIHDELEMAFGYAGFKNGGGLGGHNGLRSMENSFGSRDFKRFRLGISRPNHNNITAYVLGKFNNKESIILPAILENASKLFEENILKEFGDFPTSLKKVKLVQL